MSEMKLSTSGKWEGSLFIIDGYHLLCALLTLQVMLSLVSHWYYGLMVTSPYIGMARKQDGGSNQCISVFMAISSPGNKY